MSNSDEEKQNAMLRFQKILSQQKKKLKNFTSRTWHFIDEEKKVSGKETFTSTWLLTIAIQMI